MKMYEPICLSVYLYQSIHPSIYAANHAEKDENKKKDIYAHTPHSLRLQVIQEGSEIRKSLHNITRDTYLHIITSIYLKNIYRPTLDKYLHTHTR